MAKLAWSGLYREAELYKAAVRLYTRPLFAWRKALSVSTDGRTLYDFARQGLRNLESLHRLLDGRRFRFRPGLALRRNFNGKRRTLYVYPWEERLVDLLLYRLLNRRLNPWFSPHSYAYRQGPFGVDACQKRAALALSGPGPLYVMKRDILDYFASIDHARLLDSLSEHIQEGDYLEQLLLQRVRFAHQDGVAQRGVPFGAAIACLFANVYLTGLDRRLSSIPGVRYFRYADDFLLVSQSAETLAEAGRLFSEGLRLLGLQSKASHEKDILFCAEARPRGPYPLSSRLRHLGLEFRAGGPTGLSRDKTRKIQNLFRYAFRRKRGRLSRLKDPAARARLAVGLAREVLDQGVRNVALIDYYLRHVSDEEQLRRLDRWLAEEVLHQAFGRGHKKGHFRRMSFSTLRGLGLPSLRHRRRLIRHGQVDSPFFIWKLQQACRGSMGTAARRRAPGRSRSAPPFSPLPEAAALRGPQGPLLVGERGRLSMGVIETSVADATQALDQPSPWIPRPERGSG